jgi:hypothetical protein
VQLRFPSGVSCGRSQGPAGLEPAGAAALTRAAPNAITRAPRLMFDTMVDDWLTTLEDRRMGAHQMYANILLSTDGSDVAREGLKHGFALAKALNVKVTIITVTEPFPINVTEPLSMDFGSGHAGGGQRKKLIALTQPARNGRARCSMKLKLWRSISEYLQSSCIFQMRTQPAR